MNSKSAYRALALAFLAVIAVQRYAAGHKSVGVEQYQQAIRQAGAAIPTRLGSWVGQDVPVPVQALAVLKPNVMISRRYTNVENGAVAGLMLVHCGNAHHMIGHFPLRCYPARGWVVQSAQPRDWDAAGIRITGTEYHFTLDSLSDGGAAQSIVVVNCLLRPNGRILRDMDDLSATIVGAGGAASGAGQLQVYFDASVPPAQRDAAVEAILGGCKPLIEAILADPAHVNQGRGV
jgi:hypothetical protein